MENATHLNQTLAVWDDRNALGQNSTLLPSTDVWTTITVTVCSIGILANLFVIFTIVFSSLRTSVFMNLIMSLAIFDSMCLMSVINSERGLFGQLIIGPSLLHCRFTIFFIYVNGIVSSWVTVFISLERYIAIYHPFKVHIYCTKMNTYMTVIALKIITCIGCIPFFYGCSVRLVDNMPECEVSWQNAEYDIISKSIIFTFHSLVPFLLITILNILMMRKIQVQKALRSQLRQSEEQSSSHDSSLIVMMVCVCSIFALTSFPAMISVMVSSLCKFYSVASCILDPKGWISRMSFVIQDVNHGVNFFVYCLTGSVFRFAFFHLFKCRKKKSPGHRFEQQMSTRENIS